MQIQRKNLFFQKLLNHNYFPLWEFISSFRNGCGCGSINWTSSITGDNIDNAAAPNTISPSKSKSQFGC
jgi:hypothetical protein